LVLIAYSYPVAVSPVDGANHSTTTASKPSIAHTPSTIPGGNAAVVNTMVAVAVPVVPVAVIVTVIDPAVAGAPDTTPVFGCIESPVGNVPVVTA
jgi:hypothetical protein